MTLAQHLLEDITKALADGRTVYIGTQVRLTKITAATADMWEAAGTKLFKLNKDGDLTMASGRKYVPVTFGKGNYIMLTVKITQ